MNSLQMAVAIIGLVASGACVWYGSLRATVVVGTVSACFFVAAGFLW